MGIDELLQFPGAASCAACNQFGCRVIQRLLEFCSPDQVAEISEDLLQHAVKNCQDRYGKYAMQCLLDHGTVCQHQRLVSIFSAHVDYLGRDIHACSVIIKALSTGAREEQQALANVVVSNLGLVENKTLTKQGQYALKLAFQLSKLRRSIEVPANGGSITPKMATFNPTSPVVPNASQFSQARSR